MAFHLPVLNDHPDPLSDERIEAMRPRTYGDCLREGWGYEGGGERPRTPCPWLGCKHHLALFAADSLEALEQVDIEQLAHTCTLRVAEEDGVSLDDVGKIVGVSRERIRQIQSKVLQRLWPRRGSVIETLVLEGHEISRPDLRPTSDYGSVDMVKQIRKLAGSERTAHGTWKLKNTEFFKSKNPVRVLTGAEREARIEELRARGKPSKSKEQERPMPTSENKQSGAELLQVIREFSNAHNMPMSTAASKLGVSSSMLKRIEAGRLCMTATVEKARAAAAAFVPSTGRGRRSAKPSPAPVRPAPAPALVPPVVAHVIDVKRAASVIERLGGIDRAERIAAAIAGK